MRGKELFYWLLLLIQMYGLLNNGLTNDKFVAFNMLVIPVCVYVIAAYYTNEVGTKNEGKRLW